MKIILGINAHHADSSACILIDGKLVAAVEEERIIRLKHFSGFPSKSIQTCLEIAKINENQITDVAFNTKPLSNFKNKFFYLLKNFDFKTNLFPKSFSKKLNTKKHLKKNFRLNSKVKFHYIEHHLSHIASSYLISGYDKAIGLSIDGFGDFTSTTSYICENN